jgi:hypothetical protein
MSPLNRRLGRAKDGRTVSVRNLSDALDGIASHLDRIEVADRDQTIPESMDPMTSSPDWPNPASKIQGGR